MIARLPSIAAGFLTLAVLTLMPAGLAPVYAGGPTGHPSFAFADSCAAPLPKQLAFTGGGPGVQPITLSAVGTTLTVVRYGAHGLNLELGLFHMKPLRNDAVGEFTFQLPHNRHLYAGPVHIFRHGSVQHVCRSGPVMVNAQGSTTQQANPYTISLRLDGTIANGRARMEVWVGGYHYWMYGPAR